ncbi:alpha/beta fold hydrolase [Prauserella rugosa]|uniref:Pimeloyl-ACP methyl ester carboxylesterase n=1 Tax=Prauserella rugosa TaxID=43354 RepID=A0A660CM82_9PSEU|nr:alpha/beta hydrolase [Prauserella rugosa]KMS92701.1 alpha/beta hydrolase [Streptomyces regensis]TWH22753.1 pimeloyl-ACP methyl ester carboxylesterase [Prauserella rugosa]
MRLTETFDWRGRTVRWARWGSGPPVVFCHGTPWSSWLWEPYADALAAEFTVHLWDMPGYGTSSMFPDHDVSLDVQGELLADLLAAWGLDVPERRPHVVAHDYGGAVSLRAHLLHGAAYASLVLVDVVALAPWGSPFFRQVRRTPEAFTTLAPEIHESLVRTYVAGASHVGLREADLDALVTPWLGETGQHAFYRQMAQADQRYTDEVQPRYGELDLPVLVVWGREDTWIPVDRAHRLAQTIPGAELEIVDDAGHLIQLDQPARLATRLHRWLAATSAG